ncbi:uncharacterized protein LOC117339523 [Pecten maximus]|uniref:uncharacterized protein LOC117339523 n=1 Tax=Pecten maximus TaxID=6579 RepID=UPI0014587BBD|nr:uncharacterized protein LOC117339523 [Pecten maximus]
MWLSLLAVCVLSSQLGPSSAFMRHVPADKRTEFNKAIRGPLLQQVGLELKNTKSSIQGISAGIAKCKDVIKQKYFDCAKCLKDKYTESKPTKVLSIDNALMSLCNNSNVDYELCQIIIDQDQPFLEFIQRATKKVQQTMFSVLTPSIDAPQMLQVFQDMLNGPWASAVADSLKTYVTNSKNNLSAQGKQASVRRKRWTNYMKSVVDKIPKEVQKQNPEIASQIKKYMKMAKEFSGMSIPKVKRSARKETAKERKRTKRWIQMVSGIMKNLNVANGTQISSMLTKIHHQIPFGMPSRFMGGAKQAATGESDTLECSGRGKCRQMISTCSASFSCPETNKPLIYDVCGYDILPEAGTAVNRLQRIKEIFDAVRTKGNFITSITYANTYHDKYQNVRMSAIVPSPNIINLRSMYINMKTAAAGAGSDVISGLLPTQRSPVF